MLKRVPEPELLQEHKTLTESSQHWLLPTLEANTVPVPLFGEKWHFLFSVHFRWDLLSINFFRGCV